MAGGAVAHGVVGVGLAGGGGGELVERVVGEVAPADGGGVDEDLDLEVRGAWEEGLGGVGAGGDAGQAVLIEQVQVAGAVGGDGGIEDTVITPARKQSLPPGTGEQLELTSCPSTPTRRVWGSTPEAASE